MNLTSIELRGYKPVYAFLQNMLSGWRLLPPGKPGSLAEWQLKPDTYNLTLDYLNILRYKTAVNLFGLTVKQDAKNSSIFRIHASSFRRSGMQFPPRLGLINPPNGTRATLDSTLLSGYRVEIMHCTTTNRVRVPLGVMIGSRLGRNWHELSFTVQLTFKEAASLRPGLLQSFGLTASDSRQVTFPDVSHVALIGWDLLPCLALVVECADCAANESAVSVFVHVYEAIKMHANSALPANSDNLANLAVL
ncbi:unnamed protein product [Protopolystoma xenopodis]|uniref:Uncharacterized protein n=1 Tax=Protopolystoma xenopodis TaxID=117903 RepID=A0A3S5AXK4_9PLAT|nr:unnamed protein product [Protopolystoma xenopodis]